MEKYYLYWSYGSLAEVREFSDYDKMIECVRMHIEMYERPPVVYFGRKLEFEPAEIVKSWKIKEAQ